jgi:hypothetical protein
VLGQRPEARPEVSALESGAVTAAAATAAGSGRYGMILWVAAADYERAQLTSSVRRRAYTSGQLTTSDVFASVTSPAD